MYIVTNKNWNRQLATGKALKLLLSFQSFKFGSAINVAMLGYNETLRLTHDFCYFTLAQLLLSS